MAFDIMAYAAASKTLRTVTTRIKIGSETLLLDHDSTAVPGRFTNGTTDSWTVRRSLGRIGIVGFGNSSEVVAHGATRDEAISNAKAKLTKKVKV